MLCSACGTENAAGKRFCTECGSPLVLTCQACGAAIDGSEKFCGECGAALGGGAAPAAPPAPPAERRLVSILFADLVGFTTLSESRDAEDVRELLSRYFETSRSLIGRYGGTVEKFIGDAVMAVWGTPTATEDDAERAVRAALELVEAVAALGEEAGLPLRARAGVMTGEAAVTVGAEGEGMVAGDLVNTASRVQSVAEPGSVYVGETTRRATDQAIVYQEAGTFELKGKEGLTPLWRALRVVSGVGGALKSHGLEAPFVGRERELRRIKDLFHESADERRAHLVSVLGIAGVGKSRLAWEFYKYFDGLTQLVYWHRGRCLAYGEGVTYWALADMVRMRCRISEDEQQAPALVKLRTTIEEHVLDADERRFVEPRLAQLLGLGEHGGLDRQDLFAAWRLFFERLADVYPTVLAFEDMQWADASLLDFVEYLLEWSRNHPLFVITLARPEFLERRPNWGAGHRSSTSLHLEPLSDEAMQALLNGLVPGLPDSVRAQILERAEGIPLYAVETVRMLLDRGALAQEGSVYRPVGTIESLDVPETLHALIAARIDGLATDERRLLQAGAVLGKTFTRGALSAVGGLPEAELEPLLASLVRKEVLSVQVDPRSPEHGQYGFLQDLVRHVAYETLSKRDRRAKHLAAAEHLSSALAEEEVAEVVASHLLEAYELDLDADDAAEIRERARLAIVDAGERAAALGASAEAQRYFERSADLTADALERAALVGRAGEMAARAGDPIRARELLEQAHAAFESEREARGAARISARLGEIDFLEGNPRRAVERLEPALEALRVGEPDAVVAETAAALGRFLVMSGEDERAPTYLEEALELAERLELSETLAHALTTEAVRLQRRDRLFEARALLESALQLALQHDLLGVALRASNNLCVILESSDRFVEAVAAVDRDIELARRFGDRRWEVNGLTGGIISNRLTGRWDIALALGAEGEAASTTSFERMGLLDLVALHCDRGDVNLARGLLDRLADVAASADIQVQTIFGTAEAALLRAEGKPVEALAAAEGAVGSRVGLGTTSLGVKLAFAEALEAAAELGDSEKLAELLDRLDALRPGETTPFLRAIRSRFRGRLGGDGAGEHFEAGTAIFRELQMPFHLAVLLLEHAEWLLAQGREDEAGPLLAEAEEIFTELQARPWLERVAQLTPRAALAG